jgi:hypothetical protein
MIWTESDDVAVWQPSEISKRRSKAESASPNISEILTFPEIINFDDAKFLKRQNPNDTSCCIKGEFAGLWG